MADLTLDNSAVPKGHPKGLGVLFTTEMWERFNFYGMRTLLTLFIAEALMLGDKNSSLIYGGFLGLCYLTPMLGGYIADKFLGNRSCILLGGLAMGIGQLFMFSSATMFSSNLETARLLMWIGLLILIFGNGFFKPNISSMVGQLYNHNEKSKLDSAFTIFYMGINVGAFLGQFICPFLGDVKHTLPDGSFVRDLTAFKWGFLAAAVAMFLATITFYILKNKYVVTRSGEPVGVKPVKSATGILESGESESAKFTTPYIILSFFVMIGVTLLFHFISSGPGVSPIKSWLYPFIYGAGVALAFLILTDRTITKIERQRITVLYIVCFFVIFFWAAFEQSGSSLTFVADHQTDTSIFGWLMPPSMVQIFNGVFVVVLALPFSFIWSWLQKKRLEPISPVKQGIGLALIALGYLIIALQVKGLGTSGKVGIIWLIVLYLLHTCGELCLSPIGLSLVSKLAPKRFASLLMGVWFLSNAAGYALTGTLGALLPPTGDKFDKAQKLGIDLQSVLDGKIQLSSSQLALLKTADVDAVYPTFAGFTIHNLYEFFMLFVILCGIAAGLLLLLCPLLKKMMHGVR